MSQPLPLSLHSLHRFWWDASGYLASAAINRLGLWPVPVKAFLPRAERERLAGLIAFLEAILRRLFCLQAAELGPLPAPSAKPAGPASPGPAAPPAPPTRKTGHAPPVRAPRFRLTESSPHSAPAPPPRHFRTGPRIRFLDEDAPIDLREYPARPTDILPCRNLVRRLLAINHALDNPEVYVRRMRRLLAGLRPVLAPSVPPVFRTRKLRHLQQESARKLHEAACAAAPPDTS